MYLGTVKYAKKRISRSIKMKDKHYNNWSGRKKKFTLLVFLLKKCSHDQIFILSDNSVHDEK